MRFLLEVRNLKDFSAIKVLWNLWREGKKESKLRSDWSWWEMRVVDGKTCATGCKHFFVTSTSKHCCWTSLSNANGEEYFWKVFSIVHQTNDIDRYSERHYRRSLVGILMWSKYDLRNFFKTQRLYDFTDVSPWLLISFAVPFVANKMKQTIKRNFISLQTCTKTKVKKFILLFRNSWKSDNQFANNFAELQVAFQ